MKTHKFIPKTLASLALLMFSFISFAQPAPLTISNNTGCYFLIDAVAVDGANCANPCSPPQICVAPGTTANLNPCNIDHWVWCMVTITPTDANCTPCDPIEYPSIVIAAPGDPCSGYGTSATGTHCSANCNSFHAHFVDPFNVHLD